MLTHDSLPDERKQYIREQLETRGKVLTAELVERFDVSLHTIRRDLSDLADTGYCKKVYGGAVSLVPNTGSIIKRSAENTSRKARIAQLAAQMITPGQCVFIDAGSTNLEVARAIGNGLEAIVVTNSPLVAAALLEREGISLILLGGQVDKEVGGAVGALAVEGIRNFFFDVTFLGACAIDPASGLSAFSLEDAVFKRALIARSRQVVTVATSEKLLTIAPHFITPLESVSTLVVERDAPQAALRKIRKLRVGVVQDEPV